MAEPTFAERDASDRAPRRAQAAIGRHEALESRPAATVERDHARRLNGRPGGPQPVQRAAKPNRTGLPDRLKSGVEALSGASLDGVKVHYNSSKPAQLSAHAYAQGKDIHLAPGQERHLPHEAWHVVQQIQRRVRPTVQAEGTAINDDAGLEREADAMGARAAAVTPPAHEPALALPGLTSGGTAVAQRRLMPVQGGDTGEAKAFVARRVQDFATRDEAIAGMLASPDFVLLIEANRTEEGGDHRTNAQFNPATRQTFLMIELNASQEETDVRLAADLLHEIVLHGIPAYLEHQRVANSALLPNFPDADDDEAIEAQEAIEHGDFEAWMKMVTLALGTEAPDTATKLEMLSAVLNDLLNHAQEAELDDDVQAEILDFLARIEDRLASESSGSEEDSG